MSKEMNGRIAPRRAALPVMGAMLVALVLFSLTVGRLEVPLSEVVRILLSRVFSIERTWTVEMEKAVINIRLPRILAASIVGCGLSAAGATYQGVFRNPMASPDILGASSGAAFGAALAIIAGLSGAMISASAFAMGLAAVFLVFVIGQRAPGQKVMNLILAGIMISSLISAMTSYVKLVADPADELPAITYWLMGSLSGIRLNDLATLCIPMALGLIPLMLLRFQINIMSLGDDEARALGVNVKLVRLALIVSATLTTAAGIAVAGMIGWVGLAVPHICRRLVGSDYRALMPASMTGGALFLLAADNISRNLLAVEIPIGILTAFVGAPFFIYLLMRRDKSL